MSGTAQQDPGGWKPQIALGRPTRPAGRARSRGHQEIERPQLARTVYEHDDRVLPAAVAPCGFTGASHFSRRFRHTLGCTPTDWRTQHRDHSEDEAARPPGAVPRRVRDLTGRSS